MANLSEANSGADSHAELLFLHPRRGKHGLFPIGEGYPAILTPAEVVELRFPAGKLAPRWRKNFLEGFGLLTNAVGDGILGIADGDMAVARTDEGA